MPCTELDRFPEHRAQREFFLSQSRGSQWSQASHLRYPLSFGLSGLVVTPGRSKADESEKSARRTKADFHSVHGRRPLHGQYHGLQRPWPSSGMLSASTDVARARRWSNHLAPSVSSGGAKQLAFLFARSPLAVGMPTQSLMTRRTETHVKRAPIMSFHSRVARFRRR